MSFRIALGPCKCEEPYADAVARAACEHIGLHLRAWRARLPESLGAVPLEAIEDLEIAGHHATFTVHRHALDGGRTVIVFQVLVNTWSRPTFFALGRVGRLYAEGILLTAEGNVTSAPDDVMWEFR